MVREYCMCVAANLDAVKGFNEEYLFDCMESLGVDRVDSGHAFDMVIDDFCGYLETFGIETGVEQGEDGERYSWFYLDDADRDALFKSRYDAAKTLLDEMSLHDFASGEKVSELRMLLGDNGIVYICYGTDGYPETFDNFIRYADADTKYYICPNVVSMHKGGFTP